MQGLILHAAYECVRGLLTYDRNDDSGADLVPREQVYFLHVFSHCLSHLSRWSFMSLLRSSPFMLMNVQAEKFARNLGTRYFECSATTGEGVLTVFSEAASAVINRPRYLQMRHELLDRADRSAYRLVSLSLLL